MNKYLPFAWEKCRNQRGISSQRSIEHFIEWFWLIGEKEFSEKIEREYQENYHSYGAHILEMIENKLEKITSVVMGN